MNLADHQQFDNRNSNSNNDNDSNNVRVEEAVENTGPTAEPIINNNSTNSNSKSKNKGTGAGGKQTNFYGKMFEAKTNNSDRLITRFGFVPMEFKGNESVPISKDQWELSGKKYDFLLRSHAPSHSDNSSNNKNNDNRNTTDTDTVKSEVFVLQAGMKRYMMMRYGVQMFRFPDEAYIIETRSGSETRLTVKILEKKEQQVQGSVDIKLWAGPSLKREYELVLQPDMPPGCTVEVHYGFCLSTFLADKLKSDKKKYTTLKTILGEHNIAVLFGDDANYFERLDAWTALEPEPDAVAVVEVIELNN
jgi:hypothetical protein